MSVHTCVPFDPESKGGAEATVRIAKADLVPTTANLRPDYRDFAELAAACADFCAHVNERVHRETGQAPTTRLDVERSRLHPLPARPHTLALGTTRLVATDQTVRFGSVRYSTPPGLVGAEVWVRADGEELVAVADLNALLVQPDWAVEQGAVGLVEVARHALSTPGQPRIDPGHYPDHPQDADGHPKAPAPRASTPAEKAFLTLGPGAHAWLVEAAAGGAQRVRSKMADAVELAALLGADTVDEALGIAAAAGRFAEADLLAIINYQGERRAQAAGLVHPDQTHSVQPGTSTWAGFTTTPRAHDDHDEVGEHDPFDTLGPDNAPDDGLDGLDDGLDGRDDGVDGLDDGLDGLDDGVDGLDDGVDGVDDGLGEYVDAQVWP